VVGGSFRGVRRVARGHTFDFRGGRLRGHHQAAGQHCRAGDVGDHLAGDDVFERSGYNRALMLRAESIALAHAAGWSKYRIAQRLGITRRAVDEALTRPTRTPADFLAAQVERNGGLENDSDRRVKALLGSRERSE
jgi:hypothetical protein